MIRIPLKPALALILSLAGTASPTMAQRALIEIDRVQVANALSGIVRDPSGAPLTGATVAEVSQDGTVIESTTTDQVGSFAIVPRAKKKVYDLKISLDPNFNPLIVHVRVSRWTKKLLDLKLEVST